jgi:hypothetical protein
LHHLAQPTTINITKELEAVTTTLKNLEMMEKNSAMTLGCTQSPVKRSDHKEEKDKEKKKETKMMEE